MPAVSILIPRGYLTAIGRLVALIIVAQSGCSTPTGSAGHAGNERKSMFDGFGTAETDAATGAEARLDPSSPAPRSGLQKPIPLSKETRDLMKQLNAELRRHNLPESKRDEVLRRLLRNQPKAVADALSKVR